PPSNAARHVRITGRRRPASAPATSGSLTESRRNSMRSASATPSRASRRAAIVGAVTVTHSCGFVVTDQPVQNHVVSGFSRTVKDKKKASSVGGGRGWKISRWWQVRPRRVPLLECSNTTTLTETRPFPRGDPPKRERALDQPQVHGQYQSRSD